MSPDLSLSCSDIQHCHYLVAQGKVPEARARAVSAARRLSSQLDAPRARPLARAALDLADRIDKHGAAALSVSEKVKWLTSAVHGMLWFPVLLFGLFLSVDYAPVDLAEPQLKMPQLAPDFRAAVMPATPDRAVAGLGDLHQDLLGDCSFVLSLLLAAAEGLGPELCLLITRFESAEPASGVGESNAEHPGVKARLFFNGCWRECAVVPALPHILPPYAHRSLFVRSFSNPTLLWPALLEKAYVLAAGSHYAFAGSNMASDTYMLTRWWPEVLSAANGPLLRDLWAARALHPVVAGVGSGPMLPQLAADLGVVPNHDYVVVDVTQDGVVLTNPWETGDARHMAVDWAHLAHFSYVYVNHKPRAPEVAAVAFVARANWRANSPAPSDYLAHRPQHTLRHSQPSSVQAALVVERFVTLGDAPFCVSVYRNTRGRVATAHQYALVAGGFYTNARVLYLPVELDGGITYTVVTTVGSTVKTETLPVLEKPVSSLSFALLVFAPKPVAVQTARAAHTELPPIVGHWDMGTNGGNWGVASYINNPQFDVVVPPGTSRLVLLVVAAPLVDVNLHLFHKESARAGRIRAYDETKLVAAENYTRHFHHTEISPIDPGTYRLVVSCHDASHTGSFTLTVGYSHENSASAVTVDRVPQALGTFVHHYSFQWRGSNRHKIFFRAPTSCAATFHIQASLPETPARLPSYVPAMRALVFDPASNPTSTTDWNNSIYGVFVDAALAPSDGNYVLLVERFEAGDGPCHVTIGSTSRVEILPS